MDIVRVGVIGTGHIGTEHIHRLTNVVKGSKVVAVSDAKREFSAHILEKYPDIKFYDSAEELIRSDEVDAVIITCINPLHAPYTLLAVEAGKPVFCEKPLGNTAAEIRQIMDAEMAGGKRLVNVGFMRRFDKGYQELKSVILSREMGDPLIAYCAHRNGGDWVGRIEMSDARAIVGTAIHEIDVMSWLFDDPFVSAQALYGKSTASAKLYKDFHDPVVICMKTRTGVMVMLEINMACEFGYDIQCEVISERGIAKMPEPATVEKKFRSAKSTEIPNTWKNRFRAAFDTELQAWIDSILEGKDKNVANTWDAYRAALMTDVCIEAEKRGAEVQCELPACPAFYID